MTPPDDELDALAEPPPLRQTPARRRARWVPWLLGCLGLAGLVFLALLAGLVYIGVYGPDTSVYPGSRVPSRYVETLRTVGALEPDEELLFFYSEAIVDVKNSCSFLSDRRVGMYVEGAVTPLVTISLDDVENVWLDRDTSFWVDSVITVLARDGRELWFPVSSEEDGDQRFFRALEARTVGSREGR